MRALICLVVIWALVMATIAIFRKWFKKGNKR